MCENPNRSLFWAASPMKVLQKVPCILTRTHHCMFGSQRRKHTLFAHAVPQMQKIGVLCDNSHDHLPWGLLPGGRFATHAEVAYPPMLCRAMACAFREQLIILGATGPADSLLLADLPVHKAAQVSLFEQAGKRLPPGTPEKYPQLWHTRIPRNSYINPFSISCSLNLHHWGMFALNTTWTPTVSKILAPNP